MTLFSETVSELRRLLSTKGCDLSETDTKLVFRTPMFGSPVFAIPDVHLCDGKGGDIFLHQRPDKPRRLAAVLRALLDYQTLHPMSSRVVQLGDWFDIWRVCGTDPKDMTYTAIQNAAAYREILDLDAQLGMAHVIGNHDAGFLYSLPDMRVTQPALFRLGFWLGKNVYALHGHQSDITPPPNSSFDEIAVAAATVLGGFVPGVTTFQAYVDRLGVLPGIKEWLVDSLLGIREDPGPQARPADRSTPPPIVSQGSFVVRENVDQLATIAQKVAELPGSQRRTADVVIVGHSHSPCAAWTDVTGNPIFVVDAGSWAYDQANLLIAADDTIAVFDVTTTSSSAPAATPRAGRRTPRPRDR